MGRGSFSSLSLERGAIPWLPRGSQARSAQLGPRMELPQRVGAFPRAQGQRPGSCGAHPGRRVQPNQCTSTRPPGPAHQGTAEPGAVLGWGSRRPLPVPRAPRGRAAQL